VFPLENELFAHFPKTDRRSYINLNSAKCKTQELQSNVKSLLQTKHKSFTRADKLRLVGLTALSCGGLDEQMFQDLLLAAGLIDNRFVFIFVFDQHSSDECVFLYAQTCRIDTPSHRWFL